MKKKITGIVPAAKMMSGEQLNAPLVTNVTLQTPTVVIVTSNFYGDIFAHKIFCNHISKYWSMSN